MLDEPLQSSAGVFFFGPSASVFWSPFVSSLSFPRMPTMLATKTSFLPPLPFSDLLFGSLTQACPSCSQQQKTQLSTSHYPFRGYCGCLGSLRLTLCASAEFPMPCLLFGERGRRRGLFMLVSIDPVGLICVSLGCSFVAMLCSALHMLISRHHAAV